ncbi:MAG TPA: phosphotransferase, partial [Caldilineaceae bacterium]|nr:phosphotransferase [Caldilineaceae bacterium]
TQALAGLFPGALPTPIALEPGQDWMLLADFGPEVGWGAPVETREAVLRSFARLQIASAGRVDELLALGCVDRRLTRLADQIDPLFHDAEMVDYLDEEQQRRLPATADRLKVLCDCLAHYRVPATLMHGDMHMSNVARRADDFLFFDWSDACITHPFLDMIEILHEREQEAQMRLCDSYLAQWTDYDPMERLLEMWKMAYPLCALHQAVSYQAILANTEDACKTELAWAIPHWFSKILTALDEEREPALRTSSSR